MFYSLPKLIKLIHKKKGLFFSLFIKENPFCALVHELLEGDGTIWNSPYNTEATLADLRSLSLALLDALQDKTLALSHQRKANKSSIFIFLIKLIYL